MMIAKLTTIAAALLLVFSCAAQAAQPPGNGAVDEYTEGVPGPGGETPSNGSGTDGGNEDAASPVTPSVAADLGSAGPDGAAALALIERTGTGPAEKSFGKDAAGHGEPSGSRSSAGASSDGGGSGIPGVVNALTGSESDGGMGLALPIILGLIALAAAAMVLRRRVSTDTPA